MPEAIAEGTNVRGVISQLAHLDHKHFLIPQGKAEDFIFLRNGFIVHKFGLSWANIAISLLYRLCYGHYSWDVTINA